MPDSYRIRFTVKAAGQLEEVFDYISHDSPPAGLRTIERLMAAIDSLSTFPHRYKMLLDVKTFGEEVRSMPGVPYLVRYHVDEQHRVVTILGVRHGARRPGF